MWTCSKSIVECRVMLTAEFGVLGTADPQKTIIMKCVNNGWLNLKIMYKLDQFMNIRCNTWAKYQYSTIVLNHPLYNIVLLYYKCNRLLFLRPTYWLFFGGAVYPRVPQKGRHRLLPATPFPFQICVQVRTYKIKLSLQGPARVVLKIMQQKCYEMVLKHGEKKKIKMPQRNPQSFYHNGRTQVHTLPV